MKKKPRGKTVIVEKIAGVPGQIRVIQKDALSCEVCGHFLSMHDDRRGCRVNWCDCALRRKP